MDQLGTMRSFRRVVERGSFSRAAEDLALSPAGLSKQIRLLEERLGTVLIHRTTRRMSLTETGQAYFDECCRILDRIDELERSVADGSGAVAGRLRVNAPLSLGLTVLSPALPRFLSAHPGLRVDLTLSDQVLDVVGSGFDVSIRVRPALEDSSLVARRLADVRQIICAAPAYLAQAGAPASADDLHDHACLAYSLADQPGIWRLTGPGGAATIQIPARFSVNSSLMLRDMVLAGLGIGALPSFLVEPHLARGDLVALLPDHALPDRHVFAVYPTGRHLQRKVRAFVDFLADVLHPGRTVV